MTLLGDRDHFKFHNISASICLVSRDTVPKQITLSRLTMAAHYSCTVLVSVGTVPSVSTPCAACKTDHAESTHYGSALQLYGISISRHCAQCVDSLYCLQNGSR